MEPLETIRSIGAPAGFVDAVLRRVGLLDRYAVVTTMLGATYVAVSDEGITAVMPAESDTEFLERYHERFGRRAERRDELAGELDDLVNHRCLDAKVDLRSCNAFARQVLEAARRIPAGVVRPYGWIAEAIGKPGAARAVGTALANNPVPLVIPCHRVVRRDGSPGEYAFGAQKKTDLLEHEHVDLAEVLRRMHLRVFWSEEGEATFCKPFCFQARPIRDRSIREFRSEAEARKHGLTPCKTCHPAVAA